MKSSSIYRNVLQECTGKNVRFFCLFVCFLEERKKERKHPAETSESKCAE